MALSDKAQTELNSLYDITLLLRHSRYKVRAEQYV
jgi:hypothetical protein